MLVARALPSLMASAAMSLALVTASPAQTVRTKTLAQQALTQGIVMRGSIAGDESKDYLVAAKAGQRLSVDIMASNASLYFNILPQGSNEALFIGPTSGNVADAPLSATGKYVIRVYLMRNAARRNEAADYTLGIGLAGGDFADGLAGGPDWWAVAGLTKDALNIRSGPDLRYPITGKAQNGEVMRNRGCRMTGATRWCSIRVDGSGVRGWVAGKFLVETAAPASPETPEGGPVGNGMPFDATGLVNCITGAGETIRTCPFGVVRDGPGNAAVWIAVGKGEERQILFERGAPVATNSAAAISFEKSGDEFTISIGDELYAFPEALVMGAHWGASPTWLAWSPRPCKLATAAGPSSITLVMSLASSRPNSTLSRQQPSRAICLRT